MADTAVQSPSPAPLTTPKRKIVKKSPIPPVTRSKSNADSDAGTTDAASEVKSNAGDKAVQTGEDATEKAQDTNEKAQDTTKKATDVAKAQTKEKPTSQHLPAKRLDNDDAETNGTHDDEDKEEEKEEALEVKEPEPLKETETEAEEPALEKATDKTPAAAEPEVPEVPESVAEEHEEEEASTAEPIDDAATSKVTPSEAAPSEAPPADEEADGEQEVTEAGRVDKDGQIVDHTGKVIGQARRIGGDGGSDDGNSSKGGKFPPVDSIVDDEGDVMDEEGNVIGKGDLHPVDDAAEETDGAVGGVSGAAGEATDKAKDTAQEGTEKAKDTAEEGAEKAKETAEEGTDKAKDTAEETAEQVGSLEAGPFEVKEDGQVVDATGAPVGQIENEETTKNLAGQQVEHIDADGKMTGAEEGKDGEKVELGTVELLDAAASPPLDFSILEGKKVNKAGNIVDDKGVPIGKLTDESKADIKKLVGKSVDAEGNIWNDSGKVIGRAEPLPQKPEADEAPFEQFPDATVDKSGKVLHEGKQVGVLIEGDAKKLAGRAVDADGDVLDKHGNVVGKAERQDEEEPVAEPEPEAVVVDRSILKGMKVNKAGNVVDESGSVFGKVSSGEVKLLVGKTVDGEGKIYNDTGKVIGQAEPIPEDDREAKPSQTPFEDFPDATVEKTGTVVSEGKTIGKVTEGDAKKLAGKKVDADGDIVDKNGNVLGKAERWEEEEAAPAAEVDRSILAGKKVNKAGNVVDSHGSLFGKIIEGDVEKLMGKMCDKNGFIRNQEGDVIGKAELIPEGERDEMKKDAPFADFKGLTVQKDGKVADAQGAIVGRLVDGSDGKKLHGKTVDEDGDIVDKVGNVLGKAERWEEEEAPAKEKGPMAGRKVNREGNVVDENGDVIGKLTEGEVTKCAGKVIDDDGDIVDSKGTTVGHATLLADIPAPPPVVEEKDEALPQETAEEKEKREQLAQDKKLAAQMATCIQQSLDKIQPILKMITEAVDKAEATPKDELDEQKLVDEVKPLLEQGGQILQEANGVIRGLDPDGRIAAEAKHKTAAREATPEEYRLADALKELTGNVTQTIDKAKKKIAGMPHAKKELNPLWGLLSEPLFQILAAVGLLLSGVLGLVGKLLNGLGLGGLVNNLLGGLGITKVLDGLGLGKILSPITGSKK